ncbi:MAG: dTMP kinase [Leptospiraceae bacterium]|nr:dTMP kinase [Leptospiraceae bacterium]
MSIIKNLFIVFEGIDGSGKTTLAKKLTEKLNSLGYSSKYFYEPTHSEFGLEIRKYLKGESQISQARLIELFLLDREFSVNQNILPNLRNGVNVILDRYYYSMAAYQGNENMSPSQILQLNLEKNFPSPNVLFFLDVPVQNAYERIQKRGNKQETFESLKELERISKNYMKILPSDALRLNAVKSEEELVEDCLNYLRQG